jgi:anthranilate phosphoribosyltransferase
VLNAAAGLVVAGISPDLAEGVDRAAAVIDEGAAQRVLDDLVRVSQDAAALAS